MKDTIRLQGIIRESIVDGPGIRFVIFSQGCPHKCTDCHNPETHDFTGGYDCKIEKIIEAISENPNVDKVTFSGGEPTCQCEAFANIAAALKKRNIHILMYSGYTFEQLMERSKNEEDLRRLLKYVDVLIDGPYMKEDRDLTLKFRGSSNQRIINLPMSMEKEKVILQSEFM